MSSNGSLIQIEKLTGRDNWTSWSFAVQAYLELDDLWECVQGKDTDPKKEKKAKSKLILLVDPINFIHIQDATTSKQVWQNLAKAFQDSGLLRKVGLLRDLINTNLETSTSVEDYVNKIMSSAHKLRNIGFSVDDEWLGTLMLAGLPDEYKPMIMGIESSGVKISADLIKTKLLQEIKATTSNSALYTSNKNTQAKFKNTQHQSKSKGPRCFNCNKYGHLRENCWFLKNKSQSKENNKGFVAAFSAMQLNDCINWYIDSGASMHMTMHKDLLENETIPPISTIKIADNKILHVESCGDVILHIPNKDGSTSKILVKNVLYVPKLSTNLLSVSKIIKSGCKVEFDKTGCSLYNSNNQKVATANLINDTYRLNINYSKIFAMSAKAESLTHLWHQRLGHLNYNDVHKLPNCTTGVQLSSQKEKYVCISCLEGKQTRQSFPSNGSRASGLLELVHTDVCGPIQVASIGGARYFTTFIDDFSRKVYVYIIKSKTEVFEKFIEYKNRVENELNKKIKILRSDNGLEYTNKNFANYLKKYGILHQTSNPYTPQQNGLSERMNRTLVERAKCMMLNADLSKNYWAEAVTTAAYIINRSPTHALSDITPHEVWTGQKPDLSNTRIFGCPAMVHIPKEKRQKLDVKSRQLIFVGYSECTKGYRFIDPKTNKAVISRDVHFLEENIKSKIVESTSFSAPETKINNINQEVHETQILKDKNNNEKNNNNEQKLTQIYLPLNEQESELITQDDENTDEEEQSSSNNLSKSITDTSSNTDYENPLDDTYLPSQSVDISPANETGIKTRRQRKLQTNNESSSLYICMNGESTSSLLNNDPQSLEEALQSNESEEWKQAMKEEYESLIHNNTWSLVDLPGGKKVIPCKWVFKRKFDHTGEISRYKARLVIKGYKQKKGIDYNEIYAPVVRYTSIRYLMGIAAKYNLEIHQMDAITAFLQGDVDEDIYMSQPPTFDRGEKVCHLNKAIYGLKQASRQWNKRLNSVLLEIGMKRSKLDPCIYFRILSKTDILFISVYVDDLLLFYNRSETGEEIKKKLKDNFNMKDMGKAKQCIGFRITHEDQNKISLDQSMYIKKILTRFGMDDCKPVWTPCDPNIQLKKAESEGEILRNIPYQEAIGCLLYLSQGTRPDITYIVNSLSRYNGQPTAEHWTTLKRVLRYLKATIDYKLTYDGNSEGNITGYCDADWASHSEDRRSCTGYIFILQGAAISWCSKKQPTIALSSTEAEYMSLATAVQEAIWLKQLDEDFWPESSAIPIVVYCDNQSAIRISGNESYHQRSKHIDVRYHFIRERIAAKQVLVKYQRSQDMTADILTKGLHRPKHEAFSRAMGLRSGENVGRNADMRSA